MSHLSKWEKQSLASKPALTSLTAFAGLSLMAIVLSIAGHIFFPTDDTFPFIARNLLAVFAIGMLIIGSKWLLKRNDLSGDALGMQISASHLLKFFIGVFLAVIVMLILAVALWLVSPYRLEPGTTSTSALALQAINYFTGNMMEELIFRGFPLILLWRYVGWNKAVWIMALPFGLSHLMGLGFTFEGLKMVFSTAVISFIFAYAFITTKTLWTSIGLHVALNILLHSIIGLDGAGRALLQPVFERPDAGSGISYYTFVGTAMVIALVFYWVTKRIMERE
jgi:uncharacterized protein